MEFSRRYLGMLLPALAAAGAAAQEQNKRMLNCKVFKYENLPAKPNGANTGRAVLDAATHTDYPIELHLTELGPGMWPHPPHKHVHEEIVMVQRGELEVHFGDEVTRVGPGSVVYAASNQTHGWRNPGEVPVQYFVMALGPKA
jgi:mannose-6-phosphate isomerase-like protein (cupin superfamily)